MDGWEKERKGKEGGKKGKGKERKGKERRKGILKKVHWSKNLQMINKENILLLVGFRTFSMRNSNLAIITPKCVLSHAQHIFESQILQKI